MGRQNSFLRDEGESGDGITDAGDDFVDVELGVFVDTFVDDAVDVGLGVCSFGQLCNVDSLWNSSAPFLQHHSFEIHFHDCFSQTTFLMFVENLT